MKPGDYITLDVNQGTREGTVLAVLGTKFLVEYEMPNGTTALRVLSMLDDLENGPAMSYRAVPTKWLRAIVNDGVGDWEGRPQQSGGKSAPKPAEILATRLQRPVMSGGREVQPGGAQ